MWLQVAIKFICKAAVKTQKQQVRVNREINALKLLDHPNVIKVCLWSPAVSFLAPSSRVLSAFVPTFATRLFSGSFPYARALVRRPVALNLVCRPILRLHCYHQSRLSHPHARCVVLVCAMKLPLEPYTRG